MRDPVYAIDAVLSCEELQCKFKHIGQSMAEHLVVLQRDAAILAQMCYSPGMHFAPRFLAAFSFALIVGVANGIPCAYAQPDDTIEIERRNAARQLFEKGEQAYQEHDYVLAAKAFDDAFRIAPHHAALWNGARSWHRAGEKTRAANGYAKYLKLAPADAPDRDEAIAALATLAAQLGRLDIFAEGFEIIRVNDEVVEGNSIYVNPGVHVIEGQTGDKRIKRTQDIEAGVVRSVALVEEEPAPKSEPSPTLAPMTRQPRSLPSVTPANLPIKRSSNWFGPVAIVAGGATITTASLLVWSGIDTLSAREKFDADPTTENLAAGRDKQLRTNIFLGATVTSAIATGIFGSLWRWNGSGTNSAVTVLPPAFGLPMQVVATGRF
jgi:hypothetical protein